MPNIQTLHVAAWTQKNLPDQLTLTRLILPVNAHEHLSGWCREKARRAADLPTTMVVAGLSEILAFFVPEIAYMTYEREFGEAGPRRLCLHFFGDLSADHGLRARLRNAFLLWLGLIYPEKDAEVRSRLAEFVREDTNWRVSHISTQLKDHNGACAVPENYMVFDAITVYVASRLAGKILQFASGDSRTLVPKTPQSALYGGVELVAFPPKKEIAGEGFYTEVVTISTATFPEQQSRGIQVLARPSLRNWGPVNGYDRKSDPCRSLDVFMPPRDGVQGRLGYYHTSFPFKMVVENWQEVHARNEAKRIVARWESERSQRIFDLVRRLAGGTTVSREDHMRPIVGEDGLWVLSRLAPGSGDTALAGGSGVGWPDRSDIAVSLDAPMQEAGFERSIPMQRIIRRMPMSRPFRWSKADADQDAPLRRAGLLKAIQASGNLDSELDFLVLHKHEASPAIIRDEIKAYFGPPDSESATLLKWNDGLKIHLVSAAAGPLAEALPSYELPDNERVGLTMEQQKALGRKRQDDENQRACDEMVRHVAGVRCGRKNVGCAVLEMAASLKGMGQRDPFAQARRVLAEHRILPQVVLVESELAPEKYRAVVRDLIRMLGTLPVSDQGLPIAPAAITVIQRNEEFVGGGRIETQAFPLAVRVREGMVECALSKESGDPEWMPYAHAALRIYSGGYARFARNRAEDNQRKFDWFFANCLEQIDRLGPALVLLDMETVAERLTAFRNGRLMFDNLSIGNRNFSPAMLPNTRVVRICADTTKLPCYFQPDAKWPSGLFEWGEATRTAYGVKKKPAAAKNTSRFSVISRHLPAGDTRSRDDEPRRMAALDEICVVFKQPDDDATDLLMTAHRLRSLHTQFDDDTSLPFPLHELRLLGGAVTS